MFKLISKIAAEILKEARDDVWAVPHTREKAQALKNLLEQYTAEEKTINTKSIKDAIFRLHGSSDLNEMLDKKKNWNSKDIPRIITQYTREMLKEYNDYPSLFQKFELEALHILKALVRKYS